MESEKCIFCKIARRDLDANIVKESDNFIAFRDANPVTEGHTLIIPKKHFVTLLDMPNKLGEEMLKIVKGVSGELMDQGLADGFNVLNNNLEVAGQSVMHAHVHIIPRKEGDGVKIFH
tara:strand:+ start:764 stop:1117 length:354 start_codon:yes stop_codon:yes gene_type:complete